ncbi:phenoloxidase-activating factor 2 [Drosophila willistoni]|nr:phenoloxidase-activating factor 2 [Drosophila willistoni]
MWLTLVGLTLVLVTFCRSTTTDKSFNEGKPFDLSSIPDSTVASMGCGRRLSLFHNQDGIQFAEFPWLVAIYGHQDYLCSGVLITPLVILTSAHCVHNEPMEDLRVVAGEFDAAAEREPCPHQIRLVSELLLHPNYTQTPATHNLAMLLVANAFQMATNVRSICLPTYEMIHNISECYVAGWQRKDFGNSEILPKRATLYVLPQDQCRAKLRLAILGRRYFPTNDSLICARGVKDDFVCGDEAGTSGVPLMCPVAGCADCFVLAGVLARSARCDGPQLLGIYTNISFYRQWIDQMIIERNLQISELMWFNPNKY